MDSQEIIEKLIRPRVDSECKRLQVPPSFIKRVNAIYPKIFEFSSLCEPIVREGEIEGVRIGIDYRVTKFDPALRSFYHEMRHAKEYYYGERPSELKAILYSWRRYLQDLLHI